MICDSLPMRFNLKAQHKDLSTHCSFRWKMDSHLLSVQAVSVLALALLGLSVEQDDAGLALAVHGPAWPSKILCGRLAQASL